MARGCILYDAIHVKFENLENITTYFIWTFEFVVNIEVTAPLHLGREGRERHRLLLTWYVFFLFFQRCKANMSKCQNVLNLDYGYMVCLLNSFVHISEFHIFYKDKTLKNVFLLPWGPWFVTSPRNPRVFWPFVSCPSHVRHPDAKL